MRHHLPTRIRTVQGARRHWSAPCCSQPCMWHVLMVVTRGVCCAMAPLCCAVLCAAACGVGQLEVASMMAREAHGAGGRRDGGLTMDRFVHAMTRRIQQQVSQSVSQSVHAHPTHLPQQPLPLSLPCSVCLCR